ncbi:pilus assembly protein PilP [Ideonella livida]|uniref:pilus assembly protein PilP n=1 Tax=Ideonella livida TaxID=2707176 RepID=UPI0028735051|nr:pilus assembly protein PilP [Ideonella livida]
MPVLLVGCGSADQDIQTWLTEQRKLARPRIEKISPPRQFEPSDYVAAAVEPFSVAKLATGARDRSSSSNELVEAEKRRRKEVLESFPLDGMAMVGLVQLQRDRQALLRVEGRLYRVRVGEYLGQNFGKVTAISDTEIKVREIVQDAAGEWVERVATLELQENQK